jgi:hypothetical protein
VLLWAMTARKREDQRIVALKLAEALQITHVIRQLIVGKNTPRYNVRTQR